MNFFSDHFEPNWQNTTESTLMSILDIKYQILLYSTDPSNQKVLFSLIWHQFFMGSKNLKSFFSIHTARTKSNLSRIKQLSTFLKFILCWHITILINLLVILQVQIKLNGLTLLPHIIHYTNIPFIIQFNLHSICILGNKQGFKIRCRKIERNTCTGHIVTYVIQRFMVLNGIGKSN